MEFPSTPCEESVIYALASWHRGNYRVAGGRSCFLEAGNLQGREGRGSL